MPPISAPFVAMEAYEAMRVHVCSSSLPTDTARVRRFRGLIKLSSRTDGQPRRSSLWLELETRRKEIVSARARGPRYKKRKWLGVSEKDFWNPREREERRRRLGLLDEDSDDDADSEEENNADEDESGDEGDDRDSEGEPDDECDNADAGGDDDSEQREHLNNQADSDYEDKGDQAQDVNQRKQAPLEDQDEKTLASLRGQHRKVLAKMGEFVKFYETRPARRCNCETDCFASCR